MMLKDTICNFKLSKTSKTSDFDASAIAETYTTMIKPTRNRYESRASMHHHGRGTKEIHNQHGHEPCAFRQRNQTYGLSEDRRLGRSDEHRTLRKASGKKETRSSPSSPSSRIRKAKASKDWPKQQEGHSRESISACRESKQTTPSNSADSIKPQ